MGQAALAILLFVVTSTTNPVHLETNFLSFFRPFPQFSSTSSTRPVSASQHIGPSAIWQPGPDFLGMAQGACDQYQGNLVANCFIDQMTKAGASRDAIRFTRQLYGENGGEFGFMARFQELGPVDMAYVVYPLRDNGCQYAVGSRSVALLLVNGDPKIIDVDDLDKLNRGGLKQDESYQGLKQEFADLELWPAGRGGAAWVPVHKRVDGGQSFDVYYVLNRGRPCGRWMSGAHFDWNFNANGKFLGNNFTGGVGLIPN